MPRDLEVYTPKARPLTAPSREEFIKYQKSKARVQRRGKKRFRDLVGRRSISLVIRESAAGRKYMHIRYKKVTTSEVKRYKVAPYSYRYKRQKKTGRRKKMLFAFDFKDRHIKGFYLSNIQRVQRTDSNFTPKWEIEITL